MKQLIIVGAGGFGREVYNWAKDHPENQSEWELAGFLDDNPEALQGYTYPLGVIGSVGDYQVSPEDLFVCAIGDPETKRKVVSQLLDRSAKFIQLVHPSSIIGENVSIGEGVVICPQVVLTCDITIGRFVGINCHSSVGHDAWIGDWTTVSGHCDLTGNTRVGESSFLGSGVSLLPSVQVGDGALVGAGSVVLSSVGPGRKVFGNPAVPFD